MNAPQRRLVARTLYTVGLLVLLLGAVGVVGNLYLAQRYQPSRRSHSIPPRDFGELGDIRSAQNKVEEANSNAWNSFLFSLGGVAGLIASRYVSVGGRSQD